VSHASAVAIVTSISELKRVIGGSQLFTLGFGAIVGVGFVVGVGEWLRQAGPVGAILAFVAGGILTMLVGLCYAEMATAVPASGGEVAYAYEVFGVQACFATGWFLVLAYVATLVFEALSLAWIVRTLIPGIDGPTLYRAFDEPVTLGGVAIGMLGMIVVTFLNYRGIAPAARLQDVLTYMKIALAVVVIAVGVTWGRSANLEPLFQTKAGAPDWNGVVGVFLTSPFWLAGFSIIAQVMEEKASGTSLQVVGRMILFSIFMALVFYCLVILACAMIMPWRQLIALDLPAAAGFRVAFGSPALARTVLVVALLGNITVWNSVFICASRVLFALGRAQIVGPVFGTLHRVHQSPTVAILFVAAVASAGVLFGRRAIIPVVNVASACFAMAYLVVCLSVLKLRRERPSLERPYRVPGGPITAALAAAASVLMIGLALYQPAVGSGTWFPMEWRILGIWTALGAIVWSLGERRRRGLPAAERRALILGKASGAAL